MTKSERALDALGKFLRATVGAIDGFRREWRK